MRITDGEYRAGAEVSGSHGTLQPGKRFSEAQAAARRSILQMPEEEVEKRSVSRAREEEEIEKRRGGSRVGMSGSSYYKWAGQLAESLEQQALLLREKLCSRVTSGGKDEAEKETTSRVIVKGDGSKVLEIVTDTGGIEWKMYVEIEKGEE